MLRVYSVVFFLCFSRSVFLSLGSVSCVSQYKIQNLESSQLPKNVILIWSFLIIFPSICYLLARWTPSHFDYLWFVVQKLFSSWCSVRVRVCVCAWHAPWNRSQLRLFFLIVWFVLKSIWIHRNRSLLTNYFWNSLARDACTLMYVALYNHRFSPRFSIQIESQLETHVPLIFVLYFLSRQNSTQ